MKISNLMNRLQAFKDFYKRDMDVMVEEEGQIFDFECEPQNVFNEPREESMMVTIKKSLS